MTASGGSPLAVGLETGLRELGHGVQSYRRGPSFDLTLIFNQSAHIRDYCYPEWPDGPFAFIDTAEYGYYSRLPDTARNHLNAFSEASLKHDTKNEGEQRRLLSFLAGKSFPYFLREHSVYGQYPACYHPIEYPLWLGFKKEFRPPPPCRAEYLERDLDLFVSWGESHPWRRPITQAMRACNVKAEISVLEQDGAVRMPYPLFCARTRAARCSVSFDGYGGGSFRIMEAGTRCLLLQAALPFRHPFPLLKDVHYLEYDVQHNGRAFVSTDICDRIKFALREPERSYAIYEAAHHHIMQHYTPLAIARYCLAACSQHNWKESTPLHL